MSVRGVARRGEDARQVSRGPGDADCRDDEALVVRPRGDPVQRLGSHGKRGRRVGVGPGELTPDDGDAGQQVGRPPGVWIDDVPAALGDAGAGDGEVTPGGDGEKAGSILRVRDAAPPWLAGSSFAGSLDVAPAVDRVVTAS